MSPFVNVGPEPGLSALQPEGCMDSTEIKQEVTITQCSPSFLLFYDDDAFPHGQFFSGHDAIMFIYGAVAAPHAFRDVLLHSHATSHSKHLCSGAG